MLTLTSGEIFMQQRTKGSFCHSLIMLSSLLCFLLAASPLDAKSGCKGPNRGPPGPPGPASSGGISTSASLYTLTDQLVLDLDPIIFDLQSSLAGNISYNNVTGTITLMNAGQFEIIYGVASSGGDTWTLYLNGNPVPGAILGAGGQVLLTIAIIIDAPTAGSTLQVKNTSGGAMIHVATSSLPAFITVKQLQ